MLSPRQRGAPKARCSRSGQPQSTVSSEAGPTDPKLSYGRHLARLDWAGLAWMEQKRGCGSVVMVVVVLEMEGFGMFEDDAENVVTGKMNWSGGGETAPNKRQANIEANSPTRRGDCLCAV
ncbi:unnamed protein product [Diplocarpon coronariae]|nr:hypothetical protein JHW43_007222 [Diplocarpon mali]